jgi:hypothetical protein
VDVWASDDLVQMVKVLLQAYLCFLQRNAAHNTVGRDGVVAAATVHNWLLARDPPGHAKAVLERVMAFRKEAAAPLGVPDAAGAAAAARAAAEVARKADAAKAEAVRGLVARVQVDDSGGGTLSRGGRHGRERGSGLEALKESELADALRALGLPCSATNKGELLARVRAAVRDASFLAAPAPETEAEAANAEVELMTGAYALACAAELFVYDLLARAAITPCKLPYSAETYLEDLYAALAMTDGGVKFLGADMAGKMAATLKRALEKRAVHRRETAIKRARGGGGAAAAAAAAAGGDE